jgi:Protein of unknown function (DUF1761)
MEFNDINIWAVMVAWLINMGIGALWYSPAGFAKPWSKHTGVDIMSIPTNEANRIISFVALSALVQALTLAVVLRSMDVVNAAEGLVAGVVLWFGLVAATTVGVTLYSRKSWKFLWLNSSYFLIVMSINSVILAVWR